MKEKLVVYPGSTFKENFGYLKCPVCGMENIHCNDGEIDTEEREGFQIPMWCESYHKFTLVWEFHEGNNQIYWDYTENIVRRGDVE